MSTHFAESYLAEFDLADSDLADSGLAESDLAESDLAESRFAESRFAESRSYKIFKILRHLDSTVLSVILYNLKIMFIWNSIDARFLLLLFFLLNTVRYIVITGITTSSRRYFYIWNFTLLFSEILHLRGI